MAAVTNNTQPQTLITRNQTLLFSKDGSLFEALASIYSIDIPTLSKDETTGQTKGTGKVTGLFNRMLTIPFTNTSNLVSDMMNDVTTVGANANVIYNVSIVRNADRTISPVFERASLHDLISMQGWATYSWCDYTFAKKGHNHTEYAKSCDFSGGKFILRNVNGEVLSSVTLTGLATEGHTHNEYIKSVGIDNNGVLKFNYEQSGDAKTIDLRSYYSSTGHTHNNYIDSVRITSDGYIQLKNGTSVKSSVDLKKYYSSTGHTHNKYITSVNINNGVISLYNGSNVKSSVDLKSYYSSSNHTHYNYIDGASITSTGYIQLKNGISVKSSVNLTSYYSSSNHTHSNYIDGASITSTGYIQLKNGTSVKSSVNLTSYYSSSNHTHSDYITSVNINNGIIRLYNGSNVKSSVDLKSYYSSSKHTHSYVTSIKLQTSSSSKKIVVTIDGKDNVIDLSHFLTSTELTSELQKYAGANHKHTGIYRGESSTSLAFWYSSSALYTGGLDIYKSSDVRLKDHITSISASEKLEHFVKFNWKETGKVSYGVIAQEVEKNHPELVTTQESGFKAVSYDALLCYQLGVLIEKLKNKGVI